MVWWGNLLYGDVMVMEGVYVGLLILINLPQILCYHTKPGVPVRETSNSNRTKSRIREMQKPHLKLKYNVNPFQLSLVALASVACTMK